jgi:membrane protease YdiL (CAAX protease family)
MAVNPENNNVIRTIFALAFLLSFLFVINPLSRSALGIYLFFLVVSYLIYSSSVYQSFLIGLSFKNLGKSFIWAAIFGGGFYLVTKLFPGFSLGLPLLPNAISNELYFFIVIIVAPFVETIMFQGALLGYVREFNPSKSRLFWAVIIQAIVFALFHIGAYVAGFYAYPNFTEGLTAISANISAFISAFAFAFLAGLFVIKDGIRNLAFVAIFHLILNFIIFTNLTVIFG